MAATTIAIAAATTITTATTVLQNNADGVMFIDWSIRGSNDVSCVRGAFEIRLTSRCQKKRITSVINKTFARIFETLHGLIRNFFVVASSQVCIVCLSLHRQNQRPRFGGLTCAISFDFMCQYNGPLRIRQFLSVCPSDWNSEFQLAILLLHEMLWITN